MSLLDFPSGNLPPSALKADSPLERHLIIDRFIVKHISPIDQGENSQLNLNGHVLQCCSTVVELKQSLRDFAYQLLEALGVTHATEQEEQERSKEEPPPQPGTVEPAPVLRPFGEFLQQENQSSDRTPSFEQLPPFLGLNKAQTDILIEEMERWEAAGIKAAHLRIMMPKLAARIAATLR